VQIVSGSHLELVMDSYAAFEKKHIEIPEGERKRLRYFVQFLDAAQGGKPEKLRDCASSIAALDPTVEEEQIEANPMGFLQREVMRRSRNASPVLWKERRGGALTAGLFCKEGILEALYVLLLIYISSGKISRKGECTVCGKAFVRERGHRRTCSATCRKRLSRQNLRAAK
jgi:hypothetical protein